MWSILGTIFVGLIVGLIARALKPGDDGMGWIMTIVLGIAGAVVGGYLYAGHGIMTWVVAIVAAIVLLFLYELIRRKTPKS